MSGGGNLVSRECEVFGGGMIEERGGRNRNLWGWLVLGERSTSKL